MTGNKVRKLEYLIADAERKGADTLITCGGVQSNHCRATALAAARFGYKCVLILRGDRPRELDGNLLLDRLAGAEVRFVSEAEYMARIRDILNEVAGEIRSSGAKPYIIPEGGSDPVGALGYVDAFREFAVQCGELGIAPSRIVHATGSGGTHAGLYAGTQLDGSRVEVISTAICYDSAETCRRVSVILDGMNRVHNFTLPSDPRQLSALDQYIGPGYAKAGPEVFEIIAEVASSEGVICDPVYTGKAALAIREEVKSGRFPGITVFWHTGGVFGLFPFRQGLAGQVGWEG